PARLDLDRGARAPADARLADRLVSAGHRLAAARSGPDLRVLGARSLPLPDRGLPGVQAPHGEPARPALVGPGADRSEVRGARARGHRGTGAAAVASLRGLRLPLGRHVELETGEARARAPVRGR